MKGASNLGSVDLGALAPGALAPGEFRSGCTVPCELYQQSKCAETIPHVNFLYIYHIEKITPGATARCCVNFLNGPNVW